MGLLKYLKRTALILGSLVVLILMAVVAVLAIGISVNIDGIKAKAETAATKALGRKVSIKGHLAFDLSFRPTVELENLQIANPASWDTKDFIEVKLFRAQVRILPLLSRRIHIQEITANGIDVRLELKSDGRKNWLFDLPRQGAKSAPPPVGSGETFKVNLVEVDEFSLGQLSISFFDHGSNQSYEFKMNSMKGAAVADEPLNLAIDGSFQKQRYYISIGGDPIGELFKPTQPWHLEASAEMAGVTLNLRGQADRPLEGKGFDFSMNLNGDRFGNLAAIFGSQLPPIGAYALAVHMKETATGYRLSKLKGNFGKTAFDGKLDLNLSGDYPAVMAELMIPTIDAGPLNEISGKASSENQTVETLEDTLPALNEVPISLNILNEIDADVELKVDQIINAPGNIRDASLKVAVHDGELTAPMTVTFADVSFQGNLDLKNFNDTPGFLLSLSADQTDLGNLALETSVKVEQFDYGILARRIRPDADMSGWLSFDVDLKSRAKNLQTIMEYANGYIDFAIVPEKIEANLFELWAVNLLTAVLPKLDSEATSKVNCAVFRFDIQDGRMKENDIFADTTKMQVGGKAQVNFKTNEVYLAMAPKAKKAEFFSLATPIQVKGIFTDYKIGVQPGGFIGTALRFITSPILVPIQRIFTEGAAKDGRAACAAAMHRSHE